MNGTSENPGTDPRAARYPRFALFAPAFPMWGLVPGALLLPPSAPRPAAGEGAFWASAVILGREMIRRYRAYLEPGRLFRRGDP